MPAAKRPLHKALLHFVVDVLLVLALMFLLSVAMGLGLTIVDGLRAELLGQPAGFSHLSQPSNTLGLMLMMGVSTGGAAVLVYALRGHRASANERQRAWANISRTSTWGWIILAALTVFVCSSSVSVIGQWLGVPLNPSNQFLVDGGFREERLWMLLMFAVLLAPAYEELLFRRVLFGQLWKAGYPVLGMWLTAALFALLHELPSLDAHRARILLLWAAYGVMGLVFAWLYRKTGTLWAPFVAHALNNGTALLIAGLQSHG